MKRSNFLYFIMFFQILTIVLLVLFNFEMNTSKMLEIFVSSVWGSIFSLGGCIVFLSKKAKTLKEQSRESDLQTTEKVITISFWMLISCVAFVLVSTIYPAKEFIKNHSIFALNNWKLLNYIYDSILIGLFSWPCLTAIVVGLWVLVLDNGTEK